ncbi:hypothetical protein DPSP01_013160 [Paraphaeosphaeria sporulosa]
MRFINASAVDWSPTTASSISAPTTCPPARPTLLPLAILSARICTNPFLAFYQKWPRVPHLTALTQSLETTSLALRGFDSLFCFCLFADFLSCFCIADKLDPMEVVRSD